MTIDCHVHTRRSHDSLMTPARILATAKARGLDGIVVCDHDTIRGGVEVREANDDPAFTVIVGAEIATDAGDVTGIFLTREVVARRFADVAREIRGQGGKVILNHPYRGHDLSLVDFSLVDFVEAGNGRVSERDNGRALELARRHGLPVVAGSDAHLYAEIGNGRTEVADLGSFTVTGCSCSLARKRYVTLSQYVKAVKRGSVRVFVAATIVHVKYVVRRILAGGKG
ncbi:MAG: PHP domain-containing protein [Odoribacteraceae bacterium]|jgi:predicted metal-dependent phosphoesterase TrpH|nr:PHP domain-containing protein [Odoribacteraceae bacterium]